MRHLILALAVLITALVFGVRSGSADYSNRWCTDGEGMEEGGALQCAFATLDQCRAAASGRGMHCTQNPDFTARERGSNTVERRYRRQRNNN